MSELTTKDKFKYCMPVNRSHYNCLLSTYNLGPKVSLKCKLGLKWVLLKEVFLTIFLKNMITVRTVIWSVFT